MTAFELVVYTLLIVGFLHVPVWQVLSTAVPIALFFWGIAWGCAKAGKHLRG